MKNIKELAEKWYRTIWFPGEFDSEFYHLLEALPEIAPLSICEYKENRNKFDEQTTFVLCLYFFEELLLKYKKLGIPDKILYSTIRDIIICSQRCKEATGKLGLERNMADWMLLSLSLKLFRLGRYTFEMTSATADAPEFGIKKGDTVIGVHIPGGEKLDAEKCVLEMRVAEEFFMHYFPEFKYKCFTCYSWLLDDTLKEFLGENSNILKFQKLFKIVHKDKSEAIFKFMFKFGIKSREELKSIDAKTDFAKIIKENGLAGKQFYEALGVRVKEI